MDQIIWAIVLPGSWQDRMLTRLHLKDEARRVEEERKQAEQRLKRLGQVYLHELKPREEYLLEKGELEEKFQSRGARHERRSGSWGTIGDPDGLVGRG